MPNVPHASAQSGASARDEITKALRRFGCVQMRASAKGWALFLDEIGPKNVADHARDDDRENPIQNPHDTQPPLPLVGACAASRHIDGSR
jgi:hypothetical protein